MKIDLWGTYRSYLRILDSKSTLPPDMYGQYLLQKKRMKYKPRNKARK